MGCDCGCTGENIAASLGGKKEKVVKIYFCPKCKSEQVGFVFRLGNAFGVIQKMECRKCKFSSSIFPQWVVGQKKLNEMNLKAKKRGKK